MSAFIVAKTCIDKIVTAMNEPLSDWAQTRPIFDPELVSIIPALTEPPPLGPIVTDLASAVEFQANRERPQCILGEALWAMNRDAVDGRYGEKNEAEPYVYEPIPQPPAAVVKAIDCYLYQCSENDSDGKPVDERPLFKFIAKYCDRLCRRIVTSSPEYNAAPRGE
jgi:hypothetical protein